MTHRHAEQIINNILPEHQVEESPVGFQIVGHVGKYNDVLSSSNATTHIFANSAQYQHISTSGRSIDNIGT